MSGGRYDRLWCDIEDMSEEILKEPQRQYEDAQKWGQSTDIDYHMEKRRLLARMLKDVSEVCRLIEYLDSGDLTDWDLVREGLIQIRDRLNNAEVLKKETQKIAWKKENGNWYPAQ